MSSSPTPSSSSASPLLPSSVAQSMQDQPADFKFTKDPSGPTRRYSFPVRPSWPVLSAKIASLFDLDQSTVALAYVDEDEDVIILNSDDELQQYYAELGHKRAIKFTVRSLVQESSAASAAQPASSSTSTSSNVNPLLRTRIGNTQLDWAREELLRNGVTNTNTDADEKIMSAFESMLGAMRGPPPGPPPHHWGRRHHHHHFRGWGPPPFHHRGPPPWAHGPPGPHHGPPPPFPPPPFGPPMHHHDMYRHPRSPSPPPSPRPSPAEDEPMEEEAAADGSPRHRSDGDEHRRSPDRQRRRRRSSSPEPSPGSPPPPPPYPRYEGWGYPPPPPPPGPHAHWYST